MAFLLRKLRLETFQAGRVMEGARCLNPSFYSSCDALSNRLLLGPYEDDFLSRFSQWSVSLLDELELLL